MPSSLKDLVLPSPNEMALIERVASRIIPTFDLVDQAGRATARAVRNLFKPCRVLVLCGPGNNGADGYACARYLQAMGWGVSVASFGAISKNSTAVEMAALWAGPRMDFNTSALDHADLIVDALFGAGLNRPLDPVIFPMLSSHQPYVAVDIPSGIDGATGEIMGFAAQALHTITFFRPKPGHFLYPGRQLIGELHLNRILIPEYILDEIAIKIWRNEPGLWQAHQHNSREHKYSRGSVTVIGGSEMPGAAVLAACAARRAGAGIVTIHCPTQVNHVYKRFCAGLIVTSRSVEQLLEDQRREVWICGPGLTPQEVHNCVNTLLSSKRSVIADAGYFTAFQGQPKAFRGVKVITPHQAEFERIFGKSDTDRLTATKRAAKITGAVVVLKGPDTLIVCPNGRVAINSHATWALATAGSGDLLSGIIAALMAGGIPAWEASCAAVWIHGEAGIRAAQKQDAPIVEQILSQVGAAKSYAMSLALSLE